MQPSEILNLQKQGYTPCFISGVKPTGGNYNNKCAAYNESTGILLHGIAALDDRSGDTLPTKCGFLFATKVDGNWAKTGTKLITWYGTEVFDKINEEKSFTRGGGNGAGGASAASASPAAASAASAASAPGNASEAGQAAAAVPASAPAATPAAASAATPDASGLLSAFLGSVAPAIVPAVLAAIKPEMQKSVDEATARATKVVEYKITQLDGTKTSAGAKMHHAVYDIILKRYCNKTGIQKNPCFLWGPAGTGKSTIAEDLAADLGVTFYGESSLRFAHDLKGYEDGAGKYHDTNFFKAYTTGGMYFLDEVDNSDPQIPTFLNSAIANRWFTFPGMGIVKMHDNFYCLAAGNTAGNGASGGYLRNQLDPAFIDRFRPTFVGYDPKIDEFTAQGDAEALQFVRELRRIYGEKGYYLIASPRMITKIVDDMIDGLTPQQSIQGLIADMQEATFETIKRFFSSAAENNRYVQAFRACHVIKPFEDVC